MSNLIGTQPLQGEGLPRAAINWVVFDEQFKYVSGGFDMVGDAGSTTTGTFKNHDNSTIPTISIPKNGYIYVYCSNESKYNVFFDNLQVIHTRGVILEETHYYPFGLIMAGISCKALTYGNPQNKYLYNGIEQNNDFDLNIYDAFYRNLDPQVGRFWQIDPKIESADSWSPYSAMLNNPIRYVDPLGDSTIFYNSSGAMLGVLPDGADSWTVSFLSGDDAKNFHANVKSQENQMLMEFGEVDYGLLTDGIRQSGVNYDVNEFFAFFDENSTNVSTDLGTYKSNDGLGPLMNEHGAGVEPNGSYLSIDKSSEVVNADPFNARYLKNAKSVAGVHLHPNSGRGVDVYDSVTGTWIAGQAAVGERSLGVGSSDIQGRTGDVGSSKQNGVTSKYFDVVVDKGTIYFYNVLGVAATFKR